MKTTDQPEPVTYADGITAVMPGDRVSVRLFFRRRAGEVIYVPGISTRRGSYEHNGLTWVGVSLPDGWAIAEIVLPDTRRLKPSVRFVRRGAESVAAAEARQRLSRQDEDEAAEMAADTVAAADHDAKPRPIDWLAGAVAIGLKLGVYLIVIGFVVLVIRLVLRVL